MGRWNSWQYRYLGWKRDEYCLMDIVQPYSYYHSLPNGGVRQWREVYYTVWSMHERQNAESIWMLQAIYTIVLET